MVTQSNRVTAEITHVLFRNIVGVSRRPMEEQAQRSIGAEWSSSPERNPARWRPA